VKKIFITLLSIFLAISTAYGVQANKKHLTVYKSDTKKNRKHLTNDLLKSYLEISAFRHKVLTQNIANVNTPSYKADEVTTPTQYDDLTDGAIKSRKVSLKITSGKHINNKRNGGSGKLSSHKLKDPYEVKPNGNNVSIAQQMMKLSQNQQDYNAALKSYSATNNLLSSVIGK
jgi:flagellar basal-body rod protein FlgB